MKNLSCTSNQKSNKPRITIEDFNLQVALGKWLQILNYNNTYRVPEFAFKLGIASWIENLMISKKTSREIEHRFEELLDQVGLEDYIDCTLSGYCANELSFNCVFGDSKDCIEISLKYGQMVNDAQLIVKNQNRQKIFGYDGKRKQLHLHSLTSGNPINGNSIKQEIYQDLMFVRLNNDQNYLSVQIGKPETQESDSVHGFQLECETGLEQYLLSLSFPVAIEQVYKNVCELLGHSTNEYPIIYIVSGNCNIGATDSISIKYGQFDQFTKTKDGKKISLNSAERWTYQSDTISASNDISMSFNIKAKSSDELTKVLMPSQEFEKIGEEVEKIKILVKSIF